MKTKIMKLADIKPAPYNPRIQLKPGDPEYEALKKSLTRFGTAVPLVINERTGYLVSGHQRLTALKDMGAQEAEVVLIDADPKQEKLLNIALNKIEGDWDYEKLEELFQDIGTDDIEYTGFTAEEVENLFDISPEDVEEGFEEEDEPEAGPQEKDDPLPKDPDEEFTVYLSFDSKESAEKWMEDRNIGKVYTGTNKNIVIRMEGTSYGTGN